MQSRHKANIFDVFNINNLLAKFTVISILTLTILCCTALNPDIANLSTLSAYAEETNINNTDAPSVSNNADIGISPMSLDPDSSTISIRFDDAPADDPDAYMINLTNNDVKANEVAYISTNFTVSSYQTKEYIISLNSMNGSIGKLVGQNNPFATIDGVGTNVVPGADGNGFNKNTWGYTIGKKNDTNYAVETAAYNSVPAYGEMVNVVKEVIDKPTAEPRLDKYKLTFAAKIGDDSPADHYQTKVYLSVVRTAGRTYTVTYNGNKPTNASNNPTNVPSEQTFIETSEIHDFMLTTQKPTLDGYEFLGWSMDKNATAATYQPGGNFAIVADTPNEIVLHAVWKEVIKTLTDITYMQEMTSKICNASSTHESRPLIDSRDTKKYWVTKLKDGNCWMTQNLAYNGGGEARTYNGSSACTGWRNDNTIAQYCAISHTDSDHRSRGNYYSWPAVKDAADIICPNGSDGKDWQLPISHAADNGSFGYLTSKYSISNSTAGSTALRGDPLYFIYGGSVRSAGIVDVDSRGNYWTSVSLSDNISHAYFLRFNNSVVNSSYNAYRYLGYSVRCVFVVS